MNSDTNKSPEPYDATSNSPPNKKPLFHPKGHLTRALWSDRSVLYQENPPVWDSQNNRKLAAKLEYLLLKKQQQQDAQSVACPKIKKLFVKPKAPEFLPPKRPNTPVTALGLLIDLLRVLERHLM